MPTGRDPAVPTALYFCTSGDEYNCTVDGVIKSNADNAACGAPCLAVLINDVAGDAACGLGLTGYCAISTCSSEPTSDRAGQACRSMTDCPGGTCLMINAPITLSGDETGFAAPAIMPKGELYLTCPFAFEVGYPVELRHGSGNVKVDLARPPLKACIPPGSSLLFLGAAIHAPSGDATANTSNLARLGFYTGTSATSADGIPCPAVSVSLPDSYTGQPTLIGIGPIIGVVGNLAQ